MYHLRKYRPLSTISFPTQKKNINTNFRDPQRTPHRSNGLFPNPWFHVKKSRSISWTFFCEAVVSQCFTHVFFWFSPRKLGISWSNVTVAHIFSHYFSNQLGSFFANQPTSQKGEEFMHFVCLYEARLHDLYRSEFLKYETSPGWDGEGLQGGGLWTGPGPSSTAPPWEVSETKTRPNWKNP